MSLDDYLQTALKTYSKWKTEYDDKCKEIRHLKVTNELLKDTLELAKKNEKASQDKLLKCRESLLNLQKTINELLSLRETNERLTAQNVNLKKEIESLKKTIENKEEIWLHEKIIVLEENELKLEECKSECTDKVKNLESQISMMKQHYTLEAHNLQDTMKMNEEEANHILSQTITNYEEKLMKVNRDLKAAQLEIKNLKESSISQKVSRMQTFTMEKASMSQKSKPITSKPISPVKFTLLEEKSSGHKEPKVSDDSDGWEDAYVPPPEVTRTIKKRKLYSHTLDQV